MSGTLLLSFSSLIFILSGYVINLLLGRSLGPVNYGIYGIVITLMSSVNLVQTSGLPQAFSKYLSEDYKKSNEILTSALHLQVISTLIITIIYFILAYPIALILNDVSLTPYLQLSSLIFPAYGIYALYVGYYNGLHLFNKQAILSSIYAILKTITVLFGVTYFHLSGAISGFIIAPILALLYGFYLPKKTVIHFPYNKLVYYSLPLIGFALVSSFQQTIDLLFIKSIMHSNSAPGYYTANQNISRILFFGLSAFSMTIFPKISKLVRSNLIEESRKLIQTTLRMVLLVLIPGSFLIAATSKNVLEILYSKQYLPAAPSLSILIIGFGLLTIFTLLTNILSGSGRANISFAISLIGLCITSIACYFLIPTFGLEGAAISTTLGGLVATIISSFFVYKQFNGLLPIASFIKILFASIIIYIFATFIIVPYYLLPVLLLFLFVIYICILLLLNELTKNDISKLHSLLPSYIVNRLKPK